MVDAINAPVHRWPMRLLNAAGAGLNRFRPRRPLNAREILDAAMRNVRLEDFGEMDFVESLQLLAADYEQTAGLTPVGVVSVRDMLVRAAETRLLLQREWRTRPEFLDVPLADPLYVIGLPRTGTTLLYNLLCQDPASRPLMFWEALNPAPLRSEWNGSPPRRRRLRARFTAGVTHYLAPELKRIHVLRGDGPEECGWLMNSSFVSQMFSLHGRIPNYMNSYWELPASRWKTVYGEYRKTLLSLQAGHVDRHWILKSPVHRGTMSELLEAIPNARIVATQRDPRQVIASCCSLIATSQAILSRSVDPVRTGLDVLNQLAIAEARAVESAARQRDRILDVAYDALVRDPVGTVRTIYQHYSMPFTAEFETRMRNWLRDHPQNRYGRHAYSLEQFGLTPEAVAERFSPTPSVIPPAGDVSPPASRR